MTASTPAEGARAWTPCIKLTDARHRTYNGTQWGRGVQNPDGVRDGLYGLCGPGFYHAYDLSPVVPHFLNPLHANFTHPVVWLAEWRGKRLDDGAMKFGATELRTVRVLTVPEPTDLQRRAFAIFVADAALELVNLDIPAWREWAETWTHEPAAAANAAANAANAAYAANAANAAYAANAANAAYAANAANAAYAAYAANAANAAYAAYAAAAAAANANAASAAAAAETTRTIFENAAAWAMSREWTPGEFA